jgi:hypothetical protein
MRLCPFDEEETLSRFKASTKMRHHVVSTTSFATSPAILLRIPYIGTAEIGRASNSITFIFNKPF